MATENMLKFLRGNVANLPQTATAGALYFTKDEGIYMGMEDGSYHRYGDFIMVSNVDALPASGAHATCMYYCTEQNILCRYDSVKGWIQINKQPTAEELKTLLGLGSMAYKSEVAEGDLSAELKAKVNASAEANHSHSNKDVIDGITAEKVAAWDSAEKNAKDYADGLDKAMDERVKVVEGTSHTHANKALLDTYTQTEANLADAVAKKHSHTFNETELNKIVEGDVAKWNAVVADHLTSADKTTLENAIKEAKKAGTDANTNIETYKVANDARVLAVEEDVAEIIDGTNGILAQAKTYSDGKLATARTEITAEIDADVKVVADDLAGYKTSNDAALAGVKATAEAAATKAYTDEELAKKVDKVTGKSLVSDTEITKLAGVSEGANKVEVSTTNGNIKIDGVETVVYTHPAKHNITDIEGLQDALDGKQGSGDYAAEDHKHVKADITDFAHTHIASEITDLDATIKAYDYATKTEAQGYANAKDEAIAAAKKAGDDAQADVDALETYVGTFTASEGVDTVVKYIDAKTANIASDERVDGIENRVKAIEDDYLVEADKTELSGLVTAEKTRAEGIEAGLRTDVDAIKADYLKAADKTELEGKITAEETRAKGVEESLQTQINTIMNNPDAEGAINSINEFTQYVKDHGTIADGFRADIDKNKEDIATNAKAIADETTRATEALAAEKEAREAKEAELATAIETAKTEASNQDAVVLAEAQAYADQAEADAITAAEGKVTELANGQVATNKAAIEALTKTVGDNATAANKAVEDLAATVYTQEQVDAMIEAATSWGSF